MGLADSLTDTGSAQAVYNSPGLTGASSSGESTPTPGLESLFGGHYVPSPAYIEQYPNAGNSPATQLMQQEPWKPSLLQAIVSAIGGPATGATIRAQGLQKQMGPLLSALSTEFNAALTNGDFDTAQDLLKKFSPFAELTPLSLQVYQGYTQKLNEKYNKVESNQTMGSFYGPQAKAGTPAEAFAKLLSDKKVAARLEPEQVQKTFAALHGAGFINEPFNMVRNPITGQIDTSQTQVLPQAQPISGLTEQQRAILDAKGIPYDVYTSAKAAEAIGKATPGEKYILSTLQPAIQEAITDYNAATRLNPGEQSRIKTGANTNVGRALIGLPAKPGTEVSQQPSQPSVTQASPVQAPVQTSTTPTQVGQGFTPDEADAQIREIQGSKMSQRGKDISIARIRELTNVPGQVATPQAQSSSTQPTPVQSRPVPSDIVSGNVGAQAAQRAQEVEADKAEAIKNASNTADFATKPENAQVGWRVDSTGKFHTLANPTAAQIAGQAEVIAPDGTRYKGKWFQTSEPEQTNTQLRAVVKAQGSIRGLITQLESDKIPSSDKQGVTAALGQWAAEGFKIPFIDAYIRIGGGRTLPNNAIYAYATALTQELEPLTNPNNKDNRQMDTMKGTISAAMKTVPGAIATLKSLDSFLQTKGESLLSTAGAVEAKPVQAQPGGGSFSNFQKRGKP